LSQACFNKIFKNFKLEIFKNCFNLIMREKNFKKGKCRVGKFLIFFDTHFKTSPVLEKLKKIKLEIF